METKADPTQMSLKWFEIWRSAFLHPTIKTFSRIISDPKASTKWGIIWMAITSFIAWFVGPQRAILSGWVADNFGPPAVIYFLLIGAIVAPIFGMVCLLIEAAIAHGLARLFDGAGTFHQLVYCWAVMLLPFILLSGLVMYFPSIFSSSRSFIFSATGRTIQIISLLMLIGVNLYLFYAQVVALSAVEKIGIGKSFGIFILQAIVVVIGVTLLSYGFQALMMNFARFR
jgi:hypothetical protein